MKKKLWISILAIAFLSSSGMAGCSTPAQTHMDGSRAELYHSISEIAADSSIVVVAEVTSQSVEKRDIPYTISTAEVLTKYIPTGLGSELRAGANTTPISTVDVRQMGDAQTETPAPLLETGKKYLLFLTPTMLDGAAATQFSVTGGSAGIYAVSGESFSHGPFTEGDTLPGTLTGKDLQP